MARGLIRKLRIRVEVREGEVVPKGYDVAYWANWYRVAVCYPIPLNMIISLFDNLRQYLRPGVPDVWWQGHEVGYKAGHRDGYRDGYFQGKKRSK